MEKLNFLNEELVRQIAADVGTPCFVYDEATLRQQARLVKAFPHAFGLTPRFAMKSSPNKNILKVFFEEGISIDASSVFEVRRALAAGIPAEDILLTAQEKTTELSDILALGVKFNATSLHQLARFGQVSPGSAVGVRINPGVGSGGTNRTNVGGPGSSFGVWKDYIQEVQKLAKEYGLTIERVHTHIGSGSDPEVWQHVAGLSLALLEHFPDATTLNLGGGYKVARMATEKSTDLQVVGEPVKELFEAFYRKTGRKIHLEIEPGTFLVANAGCLISSVQDLVDTGTEGYRFMKLDAGMTDILRPSLYGAQHPLITVAKANREKSVPKDYIVVGHCCESGDILTPLEGDPEGLQPRSLNEVEIDDYLVIEGTGAYCASMSAKHYNSFPESPEVLLQSDGGFRVIRKRQDPAAIYSNEV